jgi:hypothetical protein
MLCIIQRAGGKQILSFMYTMGRVHSPLKLFRSKCMVPCTAGLRLSCKLVAFLCFFVVSQVLSVQAATVAIWYDFVCSFTILKGLLYEIMTMFVLNFILILFIFSPFNTL